MAATNGFLAAEKKEENRFKIAQNEK